jgi:hypothetical protein
LDRVFVLVSSFFSSASVCWGSSCSFSKFVDVRCAYNQCTTGVGNNWVQRRY